MAGCRVFSSAGTGLVDFRLQAARCLRVAVSVFACEESTKNAGTWRDVLFSALSALALSTSDCRQRAAKSCCFCFCLRREHKEGRHLAGCRVFSSAGTGFVDFSLQTTSHLSIIWVGSRAFAVFGDAAFRLQLRTGACFGVPEPVMHFFGVSNETSVRFPDTGICFGILIQR